MSTNFYAILPVKNKKNIVDRLKTIISSIENDDLSYLYYSAAEDLGDINEIVKDSTVHLGLRAGGWQFSWDANKLKYYEPTLDSIHNFINENNAMIVDEYGSKFTWEEFLDEIKLILYNEDGNLMDGHKYNKETNYRYSRDTLFIDDERNSMDKMYSKYAKDGVILFEDYEFITNEGLRFSLFTNFS